MREVLKGLFVASGAHMYICHKAQDLAWNYTDDLVKDLHMVHKYPRTYVNIQVNGSRNDSDLSIINTGASDINLVCLQHAIVCSLSIRGVSCCANVY